jgi:hypothetical protein
MGHFEQGFPDTRCAEKRFLGPMCSKQIAAARDEWNPKNPFRR